jgi:cytochrome c nitrite reductase small subunit
MRPLIQHLPKIALGATVPGLLLCCLFGVLLGSGGYTAYYGQGFSYLSNDPKACVNCHIMREQYDGWQKASHHAVATCNDCHMPQGFVAKYLTKAENGIWHSKGFTLQDFHEPIRIRPQNALIVQQNCVRCHDEFVSHFAGLGSHADATLDIQAIGEASYCVRCHENVGHGPRR